MLHVATPKESVEKVVKPTQADTNDKCRFCPFQLSVKYRNFGNLVRPSEREKKFFSKLTNPGSKFS